MRKTVLAVTLGSALTVVIVFGCSSPSPDGDDFDDRDRRASSSSSGSSGREGGASSGSTIDDCSEHAKVDENPECDTCTRDNCCKFVLECDESPDCIEMQKCLDPCESTDFFCAQACQLQHEEGSRILLNMGLCAQQNCGGACQSSAPDSGVDPFADAF